MPKLVHKMHHKKGRRMKEPNGKDLLATLIELLADQEGVKITYEIEEEK